MDLVQTIRKEGSRGGRTDFKWEDVKSSTHRENYLGHSLMAPVGRWQKNRDLSWYAKGDDGRQLTEAEARREEMKQVKKAEDEAMAKALGIMLPDSANANMTALGERPAQAAEAVAPERRKMIDGDGGSRRDERDKRERRHRSHRDRDERDVDGRRHRHRSRSREGDRERRHRPRPRSRSGSMSPPRHRRRWSRSGSRDDPRRDSSRRDYDGPRRRYSDVRDRRRSRSRSPRREHRR